jgi:hypothetical protein
MISSFYLVVANTWTHQLSAKEILTTACTKLEDQLESLARGKPSLGDFGQLSEFREQNKRIPTPSSYEQRVVYFDDSITANWLSLTNSKHVLGEPRINRGISRQVTSQTLCKSVKDLPNERLTRGNVVDLAGICIR